MAGCINLLILGVIANIHPAIAVPGASCNRGCLIQYNGFDPARPTIVVTHGFNPLPGRIRLNHAAHFSGCIRRRCGDRFNLMGWDWNHAAFDHLSGRKNATMAMLQGEMLACKLQAIGARPQNTWLIGHSFGAMLMSKAASDWSRATGCRVAQLTMLDPVCVQHRFIYGWFGAARNVCHVEHYWAGGCSGTGRPTSIKGVYCYRIRGKKPFTCWLDPNGNHARTLEWYANTICNSCGTGFPRGLSCFFSTTESRSK